MPEKRYLMTPGPTPAPPQVLAALAAPVIHHRARDYRELFEELLNRLGEVFQTRNDVLVYTCSGTGGMESAIANLCSPGERVLVVSAGLLRRALRRDRARVRLRRAQSCATTGERRLRPTTCASASTRPRRPSSS